MLKKRYRQSIIIIIALAVPIIPFAIIGEMPGEKWLSASDDGAWLFALTGSSLLVLDIALPLPSSIIGTLLGARLGLVPGFFTILLGLTAGHSLGYLAGTAHAESRWRRAAGNTHVADRFPEPSRTRTRRSGSACSGRRHGAILALYKCLSRRQYYLCRGARSERGHAVARRASGTWFANSNAVARDDLGDLAMDRKTSSSGTGHKQFIATYKRINYVVHVGESNAHGSF